ncbi:hypothetical protein MY8738_001949 [Beauveria namnaoensis]
MNDATSSRQRLTPRPHSRILAQDQTDELKEPFARLYPNGVPKEYSMWHETGSDLPVSYIEDNLPLGFYTKPPVDAKAIFSTSSGQRPFRHMHHILPRRMKLHLWSKNEIQENCNSIRKAHWDAMQGMTEPLCWDDLWQYFDAFDLYHHGAINLWNIINHLYAENKIIYIDVMKTWALELGRWADQWLQVGGNADKLKSWSNEKGSVIQILNEQDWDSLGPVEDCKIPMLSNALKHRRDHLLSPARIQTSEARDLVSSIRNKGGVENWMTGQITHPGSGLQEHKDGELVSTCKNFKAPCVIVDGRHYYGPQARSKGAVEALKASVEAASSHIVVANGSRMSPPEYHLKTRTTAKCSGPVKPAAHSQQTCPSPDNGSATITPCTSGTSHSGSPRSKSDTTVRPSLLPSPEMDPRPAAESCSLASTGDFADQLQSQAPPTVSGQHKIMSPYRGKRTDSYASQHNSPPSLGTQYGGFNPGGKPSSKKWNADFRRHEHFGSMPDIMHRDSSKLGMPRTDIWTNSAAASHCPNALPGLDRSSYIECGCHVCALRNRSIWVRVADRHSIPVMEVQTRLRFGVESRFGRVEDVNFAGPRERPGPAMNFIVRFCSEDSVCQALAHGGGRIEEKGIKISISPMFRSKWIMAPSQFPAGNQPVPQDSIYRVVKGSFQRRGDLPLFQDMSMPRGGPSAQRAPSGGPFAYNNQSFGQMESSLFGQAGPYPGKKSRYLMNADGSSRGHQPFHAFNPQAQFFGPMMEACNPQQAARMHEPVQQTQKMGSAPLASHAQSRPVAKEVVGEIEEAVQSTVSLQDMTTGKETIKFRVSLPEMPARSSNISNITLGQCLSQDVADQTVSDAAPMPSRENRSPVKQSKKKRQATQLRAADFECTEPTKSTPFPPLSSAVAAASAVTVTGPAQPRAVKQEDRRSSLFTEDEIKERKKAWNRIAVPLSSPRKQSFMAEDTAVSAKPGHDRTRSLPATVLTQSIKMDAIGNKSAAKTTIEPAVLEPAECDSNLGADAGDSATADRVLSTPSSTSPKKSSKSGRKKKNKQDLQAKVPSKKEYKL